MQWTDFFSAIFGVSFFLGVALLIPYLLHRCHAELLSPLPSTLSNPEFLSEQITLPSSPSTSSYLEELLAALRNPGEWEIVTVGPVVRLQHHSKLFCVVFNDGRVRLNIHTAPHSSLDIYDKPWVYAHYAMNEDDFRTAVLNLLVEKTLGYVAACEDAFNRYKYPNADLD